ncbi:hypothetical protein QC764_0077360 [Podospora pseudoanserina]|uniref:Uncharacterized protein n=1 Tax=Podospora pseudoanserina TaxID=2609844 RepID=A0ABR0I5F9_9PEZI|nr:hypothetical protein QC764_0077360 [Podospora pseudoanserina]
MVKGGQDFEIHLCLAIHPGPHGGSVGGRRCAVFAPAAHISVNIQTITPDFTLFPATPPLPPHQPRLPFQLPRKLLPKLL